MNNKIILKVAKNGTDFSMTIPAGTMGKDVEIGLAYAIKSVADHQKSIDPTFKTETLLEKVKGWIKCME